MGDVVLLRGNVTSGVLCGSVDVRAVVCRGDDARRVCVSVRRHPTYTEGWTETAIVTIVNRKAAVLRREGAFPDLVFVGRFVPPTVFTRRIWEDRFLRRGSWGDEGRWWRFCTFTQPPKNPLRKFTQEFFLFAESS